MPACAPALPPIDEPDVDTPDAPTGSDAWPSTLRAWDVDDDILVDESLETPAPPDEDTLPVAVPVADSVGSPPGGRIDPLDGAIGASGPLG
jgi:hypothetical protein